MIDAREIADLLGRAVDRGDAPGVAVSVATEHGIVFEAGFGRRDLNAGDAMDADSVVWIASMTKPITTACALRLVEQGRLDLDAPAGSILPALRDVQVLDGFDARGEPRLRTPRGPIAVKHLLNHTSGFVYGMWNADIARYMQQTATPGTMSGRRDALMLPLTFDPGAYWDYGIGVDWAGRIVEAVTGRRLGVVMKEVVFDPLGMSDTGFRIGDAQRTRLARAHAREPDGGLLATDFEAPREPESEGGGGGLYSTVSDYMKFARMISLGGSLDGVEVLKPATVALMSNNSIGDLFCRPLKSAMPKLTNDVDFTDGMKWSLGFMINPHALATGRSAGSLSWAGLANTYFWIDPSRKIAGVFVTQIFPFADERALALSRDFEAAVYRSI